MASPGRLCAKALHIQTLSPVRQARGSAPPRTVCISAVAGDADVYRKMTATPAGCVRPSQAGTKLNRTQTAGRLLRFGMQSTNNLH